MIINMTQNVGGLWSYSDPVQADLAFQLEAISGLDLTSYDVMLNDDAQWVGHDKTREGLVSQRHQLSHAYKQFYHDNAMLEVWCEKYWLAIQSARMHVTGTGLEIKDLARVGQARAASKQPRPNAKSEIKEQISAAMRPSKLEQIDFKSFMQMWQNNKTAGLTIQYINNKESVIVTDDEGDLGTATYTWGSLKGMYSRVK